ncbi:hypothetical protein BD324DRAFT_651073 [Kockovaella imperatae]|uniref:DASH complex subunit DAD2 n=1 Tax=Kockovaella imperatae TaxID=4999 RepID=A0A1Y1UEW4_9TREE|nr:hypothetical protein BD324DRAFT_651073 [Kockovaella imperatae]ORX36583.1 hypothetical protein BD324DRAFT_651073 [Kockovaella imperatae]
MTSQADDPSSLPPAHQLLLQKQREHLGLLQLRDASKDLLERVEKLAEMNHIMADGGEAIGQVMKNWPHVFGILNLFDKPPGETRADEEAEPIPTLVRIPYTSTEEPGST